MNTTENNDTDWRARLALQLWGRQQMTWGELQQALREAGCSEQRALELATELGL